MSQLKSRIVSVIVLATLVGGCAKAPPPAAAPDPAAAKWSALAKLPDWNGVWEIDWRNARGSPPRPEMKLTPDYQKKLDAYRASQKRGENTQTEGANCVPPGVPGIMSQPYPIEFLYQPNKVAILIEPYMQFRQVYTDGRKHPEDPDLTYNGHSVGHWEGDTLVIETVGLKESTSIAPGVPHSEQLRITERVRKADANWLEIETTLVDPIVLAEPYTSTISYRHLDDEIREYICLENNRDGADEKGRPTMSLE
jgi:hypothetical protein